MSKWRSCAEWPEGYTPGLPGGISTDDHSTAGQAQAVCEMLERAGFGGDSNIFPIRTWVEAIKD